jgi:endonuclease/exonuclease/phosphatase family metal-dependent hydrolase
VKKWALEIAESTGTRAIVLGDLNLPKNLPVVASKWKSLITQNTYPSWGAKIQFDYLLSPDLAFGEFSVRNFAPTGVSDHLPIGIEIFG